MFQLSNASGQSWLCKSEMLRSGAKAAAIGNRNNVANLVQRPALSQTMAASTTTRSPASRTTLKPVSHTCDSR
jgi:hypothetical protein